MEEKGDRRIRGSIKGESNGKERKKMRRKNEKRVLKKGRLMKR